MTYLDHFKKTMEKNLLSALLGALASVALFALAFFALDQSHIDKFLPDSKWESYLYFPMLIVGPACAITAHELGHLFTGLALGQRFKLLVVAFLGIAEEAGKIKIFFNTNLGYFGGIAATVPQTTATIDHRIFAKILIAGPLTSLGYGILCLWVFFQFDSAFNSFFALSGLTSIGLFLATTLPEKSGIMYTDRKRFQRLHQKGPTQDAEIAMYQLFSQSIIENSFKNIDLAKTYILGKDPETEMQFWAEYIRYQFYKDNMLDDKKMRSKKRLEDFRSEIGESVWKSLKIE